MSFGNSILGKSIMEIREKGWQPAFHHFFPFPHRAGLLRIRIDTRGRREDAFRATGGLAFKIFGRAFCHTLASGAGAFRRKMLWGSQNEEP